MYSGRNAAAVDLRKRVLRDFRIDRRRADVLTDFRFFDLNGYVVTANYRGDVELDTGVDLLDFLSEEHLIRLWLCAEE